MGRIFSFDDVAHRRVPRVEDFQKVRQFITAAFLRADAVVGAVFCGSVVSGVVTERSDVDCFVIYQYQNRYEFMELLRELNERASALHVPIEFIPLEERIARGFVHRIGPSFLQHLSNAAARGGIVKDDPIQIIVNSQDDSVSDVRRYLQHKIHKMEEILEQGVGMGPDRYEALQQILDVPVHAARKMLRVNTRLPRDDSKQNVVEVYSRHAPPGAVTLLGKIVQTDARYSHVLQEQLRTPHEIAYQDMLQEIESHAWTTYELLRRCALELSPW